MAEYDFTTGSTLIPDVGKLEYNGCTFSPLFESKLSGTAVKDEANRTVKYTEIVLTVDGYVTMGVQAALDGIAKTMTSMHRLLTQQGGSLTYEGRGFDLIVNGSDVAWGPVPELLEFQPLGGGLSAKVKWQVTLHLITSTGKAILRTAGLNARLANQAVNPILLQFNYETSVSYGEDGFSTLSMRGTLEIPLARITQATRTVPATADDFRHVIQDRVLKGIDLSRFRVTKREFSTSRDKRTLSWDFVVEEKPYMDLPPSCTVARGSFNVRPARTGPGLALWLCSLQVTYTLRNDVPRRQAYLLFLALLRLRMSQERKGSIPALTGKGKDDIGLPEKVKIGWKKIGNLFGAENDTNPAPKQDVRAAILLDFSINEGLYLDSKTVSFSATWRLCTTFSHILVASGLWTKVNEKTARGGNLWATTVSDISGSKSWLENRLDKSLDVIVDFGSNE